MAGHLTKPTNRIGWISDFNGLVYCTRKIGLVSTMAPLMQYKRFLLKSSPKPIYTGRVFHHNVVAILVNVAVLS